MPLKSNETFWDKLQKPIFCLAPLADVTDAAFRRIIAKYGKPDIFWTEFTSADGLCDPKGRKALKINLSYTEKERPIVAQLFSSKPEKMRRAARYAAALGFDGIDINMGCPDRSIEKSGAGAALIKNPKLAVEIIRAAIEGAKFKGKQLPVSVKTRLGYNKDELETWARALLGENIAALTMHARTRKEMSLVPARWERIKRLVEIRDEVGSKALIIGNGDAPDIKVGLELAQETGADGVMFGRAIFGNPWLFANLSKAKRGRQIEHPALISPENNSSADVSKTGADLSFAAQSRNRPSPLAGECAASHYPREIGAGPLAVQNKLSVMVEHTKLFEKLFKDKKNFAIMRKHFKAYCSGFDNAKELRIQLMETKTAKEVEICVTSFLSLHKDVAVLN